MSIEILKGCLLLLLFLAAWEDYHSGFLSLPLLGGGAAFGVILQLLLGSFHLGNLLSGTSVGFVLLIIAFASREKIGYGDGLLFSMIGIYLGGSQTTVLLLLALGAGAVLSVCLLLIRKKKGQDSITFAPLVLFSYIVYCIWYA